MKTLQLPGSATVVVVVAAGVVVGACVGRLVVAGRPVVGAACVGCLVARRVVDAVRRVVAVMLSALSKSSAQQRTPWFSPSSLPVLLGPCACCQQNKPCPPARVAISRAGPALRNVIRNPEHCSAVSCWSSASGRACHGCRAERTAAPGACPLRVAPHHGRSRWMECGFRWWRTLELPPAATCRPVPAPACKAHRQPRRTATPISRCTRARQTQLGEATCKEVTESPVSAVQWGPRRGTAAAPMGGPGAGGVRAQERRRCVARGAWQQGRACSATGPRRGTAVGPWAARGQEGCGRRRGGGAWRVARGNRAEHAVRLTRVQTSVVSRLQPVFFATSLASSSGVQRRAPTSWHSWWAWKNGTLPAHW